jgi:hypothetical protein
VNFGKTGAFEHFDDNAAHRGVIIDDEGGRSGHELWQMNSVAGIVAASAGLSIRP